MIPLITPKLINEFNIIDFSKKKINHIFLPITLFFQKRNQEINLFVKKEINKIFENEFNQSGKIPIHWKLLKTNKKNRRYILLELQSMFMD